MTVPWLLIVWVTVKVAGIGSVAVLAVMAASYFGFDQPPKDPETQFALVRRAMDRARRKARR